MARRNRPPRCTGWSHWLLALAVLLAAAPASAGRITGRLELTPPRGVEMGEAVVFFQAHSPRRLVAPETPVVMETRSKEFVPTVVVVPKGGSVRFPNGDPILHNVFSVSGNNRFDLGLYGRGDGRSWQFNIPGIVRVFCNVHHEMVGYVLVLDTPFFTTPSDDGRFALDVFPDEPGTLTVWHPRAGLKSVQLKGGDASVDLQLEVTRKRVPEHRNKDGRSYRRRRSRYE